MLKVRGLTKRYSLNGRPRTLFQDLSFDLKPGEKIGLMGRNGQGKSTFIKILGGVVSPTAGQVDWDGMRCSWPLGFGGAFQGGMTGLDNIRFTARIYRRDVNRMIRLVDDFAQLGEALTMPVKLYSTGMRARLGFGLSLAIEFDCYLIDEVIAVGDALFREKCDEEIFVKRSDRAFVIASHDLDFLRKYCTKGIVIENGRAKLFEDIDLAVDIYISAWEEHHAPHPQAPQAIQLFSEDHQVPAEFAN